MQKHFNFDADSVMLNTIFIKRKGLRQLLSLIRLITNELKSTSKKNCEEGNKMILIDFSVLLMIFEPAQ
jgi:hypothetical protein